MKKLIKKRNLFILIAMGCLVSYFTPPSGGDDLMGPDKDGNGVRDDIDEWINNQNLDYNKSQALRLMAKNLRLALRHHKDREKSNFYLHERNYAGNCFFLLFNYDSAKSRKYTKKLRNQFINNKRRVLAYADVNSNFSGQVGYYGEKLKDTCKFKLSEREAL